MSLYAIGVPGKPVRVVSIAQSDDDARAMRLEGESVHTLSRLPTEPVMITEDNVDVIAIPKTLEQAQIERWEYAKAVRSGIASVTATPKGDVQSDADSISRIVAVAAVAARANDGWTVPWKMASNDTIEHSADDMLAMADAVVQHVTDTHAAFEEISKRIFSASSVEEVNAIDVE